MQDFVFFKEAGAREGFVSQIWPLKNPEQGLEQSSGHSFDRRFANSAETSLAATKGAFRRFDFSLSKEQNFACSWEPISSPADFRKYCQSHDLASQEIFGKQLSWSDLASFREECTIDQSEKIFNSGFQKIKKGQWQKFILAKRYSWSNEVDQFNWLNLFLNQLSEIWSEDLNLLVFLIDGQLVIGAVPETLFTIENSELQSMALAGTKSIDQADDLLHNKKELAEHLLVADEIEKRLSDYNGLVRGEPYIWRSSQLAHLRSDFRMELKGVDIDKRPRLVAELIRRLHPTPALGVLPWNQNSRTEYLQMREEMRVSPFYGSPWILQLPSKLICLVAIRYLSILSNEVFVDVGAGVVKESQFEKELKEIELKLKRTVGFVTGVDVELARGGKN